MHATKQVSSDVPCPDRQKDAPKIDIFGSKMAEKGPKMPSREPFSWRFWSGQFAATAAEYDAMNNLVFAASIFSV